MKPIHKLNNGRGATLCHTCSVIISTGLTKDLYCEKCKQETLEQIDQNNPITKGSTALVYKQETLEEAAEWLNKRFDGKGVEIKVIDWNKNETNNYPPSKLLEEYAKWKQERSYSEEEIRQILIDVTLVNPKHLSMLRNGYGEFPDSYELTENGVDYIIEQFKKK